MILPVLVAVACVENWALAFDVACDCKRQSVAVGLDFVRVDWLLHSVHDELAVFAGPSMTVKYVAVAIFAQYFVSSLKN